MKRIILVTGMWLLIGAAVGSLATIGYLTSTPTVKAAANP